MVKFFVPYSHNEPAAVEINGHRLLIVSTEQDDILEELEAVGGDEIREIVFGEADLKDESLMLAQLAEGIDGGVVLAPPGITPRMMIESLEQQLPWIH